MPAHRERATVETIAGGVLLGAESFLVKSEKARGFAIGAAQNVAPFAFAARNLAAAVFVTSRVGAVFGIFHGHKRG